MTCCGKFQWGAMIRCEAGKWHRRDRATVASEQNESGALVQKVICTHKVGK